MSGHAARVGSLAWNYHHLTRYVDICDPLKHASFNATLSEHFIRTFVSQDKVTVFKVGFTCRFGRQERCWACNILLRQSPKIFIEDQARPGLTSEK